MTTTRPTASTGSWDATSWHDRVGAVDWDTVGNELDSYGCALTGPLLSADEAAEIASLYPDVSRFRSTVDMRRYRFGEGAERYNRLHPTEEARQSYVAAQLDGRSGPAVAATDYMRAFAEQIRPYMPGAYTVLGTDGFGRSDYRVKLRRFFEVDRYYVAVAALKALADEGSIKPGVVAEAITKYKLDTERAAPWTV